MKTYRKLSRLSCRALHSLLALAVALAATASASLGQEETEDYVGRTPPRLSMIEGQVSTWRAGYDEWQESEVNFPLAPGDHLATGPDGKLELQVGRRGFLRTAPETEIRIEAHDTGLLGIRVLEGRATLDLRDIQAGARAELETPDATVAITDPGLYDIAVNPDRSTFAALQGGRAVVLIADQNAELAPGSVVVVEQSGRFSQTQAPGLDEWLRWNTERTDRILQKSSRGYVSEDVYGLYELEEHGTWREEPEYGRIWTPSRVPADWAPYSTGRWVWDVEYGWSWVDQQPWGWAPYHYGRWISVHDHWAWAPGPYIPRPVYSPALVAFFGSPGVNVSVSIGPSVSWIPLGWGEPVVPWWGPTHFRRRPCWNGWGGPTIINHIHVDRHRVHLRDIHRYHHQDRRNAWIGVHRDQFGRRSARHFHVPEKDRRHLRPVLSDVPIRPRDVGVRRIDRDQLRSERAPRPDRLLRSRPARDRGFERPERSRLERERPSRDERARLLRQRPDRPGSDNDGDRNRPDGDRLRDARRDRPDRPERPGEQRQGLEGRPGQPERPDRPDRPRRPDRPDSPERPDAPARPGSADRPDSSDRRERRMRPDRPDRPEVEGSSREAGRPEPPPRPGREDRMRRRSEDPATRNLDRPQAPGRERPDRPDRPDRPEAPARPGRERSAPRDAERDQRVRPEAPARPERPRVQEQQRPARPEPPARPERPQPRSSSPEQRAPRAAEVQRPARPEAPARPERREAPARPERREAPARPQRPERPQSRMPSAPRREQAAEPRSRQRDVAAPQRPARPQPQRPEPRPRQVERPQARPQSVERPRPQRVERPQVRAVERPRPQVQAPQRVERRRVEQRVQRAPRVEPRAMPQRVERRSERGDAPRGGRGEGRGGRD